MPGGRGPRSQASVSIEDIVANAKDIEGQGYDVITMSGNKEQIEAVRNATNLIIMSALRVGGGGMGRVGAASGEPGVEGVWSCGVVDVEKVGWV